MKVLFLDIDGVVNSAESFKNRGFTGIDRYMAFLVGNMVDNLKIEVVLSSSWRHHDDGMEEIRKHVCSFIDITPTIDGHRGTEIKAWLDKHPEVSRYAIIDDDSDMLPEQLPNFFKTSWQVGITPEIVKKITEHFNKPNG